MAKKTKVRSRKLFEKTDATSEGNLMEARSIGLRKKEWDEIQKLADELHVSVYNLGGIFLRYGIKQYKAGDVKIKTVKTTATVELEE